MERFMPHIIVKLWPGKSMRQKQDLADKITQAVMDTLRYGEESVSVGFEEVTAKEWMEKVYEPDIRAKPEAIYKKPGYSSV
jgi:4-oxalocrotonate tautomerase